MTPTPGFFVGDVTVGGVEGTPEIAVTKRDLGVVTGGNRVRQGVRRYGKENRGKKGRRRESRGSISVSYRGCSGGTLCPTNTPGHVRPPRSGPIGGGR